MIDLTKEQKINYVIEKLMDAHDFSVGGDGIFRRTEFRNRCKPILEEILKDETEDNKFRGLLCSAEYGNIEITGKQAGVLWLMSLANNKLIRKR